MDNKKFFSLPLEQREVYLFKCHPITALLKEVLLSKGGNRVVWMGEEQHLTALIKDGMSFNIANAKLVKGDPNRCHTNTAKMFLEKPNVSIATGYVLDNGTWRSHSWGLHNKRIMESTTIREQYYGAVLNGLEITKFVFSELGNEVMGMPEAMLSKLPLPSNLEIKEEKLTV